MEEEVRAGKGKETDKVTYLGMVINLEGKKKKKKKYISQNNLRLYNWLQISI